MIAVAVTAITWTAVVAVGVPPATLPAAVAAPATEPPPSARVATSNPTSGPARSVGVGRSARWVPASSADGSSSAAQVQTVLNLRFRAVRGERRLVAARVLAHQPRDTPDAYLMATVSVTCAPEAGRVVGSSATQNLRRGHRAWLQASFVYVAARDGAVSCSVRAYGSRPRPTYGGRASLNRWYAWYGSRLFVGARQPAWAATRTSTGTSQVATGGTSVRSLPVFTHGLGSSHRAVVLSDHKVTTCSSVGGSRDGTTGGRELCAGHVSGAGSRVRLLVRVRQVGCGRARTVVDRTVRVTPEAHHQMLHGEARLRASRASGCRRAFVVSTTLRHVGGAAYVVHAPSERTTIALG